MSTLLRIIPVFFLVFSCLALSDITVYAQDDERTLQEEPGQDSAPSSDDESSDVQETIDESDTSGIDPWFLQNNGNPAPEKEAPQNSAPENDK